MRVFKNRGFAKFAKKNKIADDELCQAVSQLHRGLAHADLGGGVFKQRLARKGQGKSGGFRTIIVFQYGHHSFFVFGFAKNELANISPDDLFVFRKAAKELLNYGDHEIEKAVEEGEFIEVFC